MGNVFSVSLDPSRCLDCTIAKAKYVSKLRDNLAALKTQQQDLTRLKADVIQKINLAEQRQMRRRNQGQGWLEKVEAAVHQVDEVLSAESQETEKLCLGGYCSNNCKSSYSYGKLVHTKLELVNSLKEEGGVYGDNVAEQVPEAPVDKLPIEPTIVGQESMFDKVWRCITEEDVGIIGLYGTGGVGKTTLLTQINNKFCDEQQLHFDVVIWTVVSKELRLEKIQEDIGKKIGLWHGDEQWKDKNPQEKARDIFKALSEKRFVLLLDDIWEQVDLLTEVGVPYPNTTSKIIFTTRFEDVCGHMRAHKRFRVECLGHDEAWELFRKNLQGVMLDECPDILPLAKEVAEECGGLPLVIKIIAQAMSCNTTPEEWDYAIQVLKRPAPEFASTHKFLGMKQVFHRLKFSYDRLVDDKIKSYFKYCYLFPEDYLISKRELIYLWIGEGFLDEFDGRVFINQGYTIINTLLRACLLEDEKNDLVKLHDVIRDMALWISCEVEKEKENVFVCESAGLTKTVEASKWEGVRRMSLMHNRIKILPKAPTCPSLITLFLNDNIIEAISPDFFQNMSSLRVLNLSNNYPLTELPLGISKLILLEYLNLRKTSIEELPDELKSLVNLKCLILEETPKLCMAPSLISSFSSLQVLIMPVLWRYKPSTCVPCNEYSEFLVEELHPLEHLSVLSIAIESSNALQKTASLKLQRCTLHLTDFNNAKSFDILSVADVENLDKLLLSFDDLEELKINWNRVQEIHEFQGFKNLHRVTISCFNIRETTWLIFAPNIKALKILQCLELEEVINYEKLGEVSETIYPFSKLEFLNLEGANKLKSIYWKALPFPKLEQINVRRCPNLKKLPLDSNSTKESKVVIEGEKHWLEELQWEDQPTQIVFRAFPA